jgi:hypothetical protein
VNSEILSQGIHELELCFVFDEVGTGEKEA